MGTVPGTLRSLNRAGTLRLYYRAGDRRTFPKTAKDAFHAKFIAGGRCPPPSIVMNRSKNPPRDDRRRSMIRCLIRPNFNNYLVW